MKTVRIGGGAGYSGDRIEPAVELAERGALDYLVFECLAERTIGLAQQAKARDAGSGFDPFLRARMRAVLPACRTHGVRIVTNMGAANPEGAAAAVVEVARELGLEGVRVAAVTGDDVLDEVRDGSYVVEDTDTVAAELGDRLVSANAYVGAPGIIKALATGADVVITGRAADPSLFLGPLMHEFGWREDDWDRLGAGTVVGHLLECAGQVTGGYFADPGRKDVPDLARLGFPLAEVSADGSAVITKVDGSGGCVRVATCTEQLLYEIHDPARYLTPDVVADFSHVRLTQVGPDRVRVVGARGMPRPDTLKVSVGYRAGYVGEGQMSYGGVGAVARAELALAIVRERLAGSLFEVEDLRGDLIGVTSLYQRGVQVGQAEPCEVRLRVVGRTSSREAAQAIGDEVETLYTNGPAGGAGATRSVRELLAVSSTIMPRDRVPCRVSFRESRL